MQKLLIFAIGLFTLFPFTLRAQVLGVEYWFENNPFYRQTVLLTPDAEGNVNFKINPEQLTTGLHQLSIRVKDSEARYSPVESHWFFKCEDWDVIDLNYWLDDEEQKHEANLIEYEGIHYGQFPTADLPSGFHKLSYTLKNGGGKISTVHEHWFYKSPHSGQTYFTYWIDDDVQNRQSIPVTTGELANLSIDVNNYSKGSHRINYTISDTDGSVSAVSTEWFTSGQNPNYDVSNLKVTDVKYWFNDLDEKSTVASVKSPDFEISMDTLLSTGGVELGDNKLYYQFCNSAGLWSGVESATFDATVAMPREMNLVKLSPDINQLVPAAVKEYASVYYHYRFSDKNGKGVKGMRARGKLDNSNEIFLSQPSDTSGVVQLKIPVWGRNLDDKNDDLIKVYETKDFRFDAALYPINTEPVLLKNEFTHKAIGVVPYKGESKSLGLSYYGNEKFKVDFPAKYSISQKGKMAAGLDIALKYDNGVHVGNDVTLIGSISSDINIKDTPFDIGFIKPSVSFGFSPILKGRTSLNLSNDAISYLFIMLKLAILDPDITNEKNKYLVGLLSDYLSNKINPIPTTLEGTIEATFTNSASLEFGKKDVFSMSAEVNSGFTPFFSAALEIDKYNNSIVTYKHGIGTNIGASLEMGLDESLVQYGFILSGENEYNCTAEWKSKKFEDNNNLIKRTITLERDEETTFSGNINIAEVEGMSDEYGAKTSWGKTAISDIEVGQKLLEYIVQQSSGGGGGGGSSWVKRQGVISSQISPDIEYLLGKNPSSFIKPITVGKTIYNDMVEFLQNSNYNYQQTYESLSEDCKLTESKKYEVMANVSKSFKMDFVISDFSFGFGGGIISKGEFPLSESYYHFASRKLLNTVKYEDFDRSMFYFAPFDWLDEFWGWLKSGYQNSKEFLKEHWSNTKQYVTEKVGQVRFWFSNGFRNPTPNLALYYRLKSAPQNNYSILTFDIPGDVKAFNLDTELSIQYFYPGGELLGITEDNDTVVFISDVFFLDAVFGTDTLKAAPNGNFTLKNTVGSDDLTTLSLNPESPVSVFYKAHGSALWHNLGAANSTLSVNGLGTYALGVDIGNDTVPPVITIEKEKDSKIVFVQVTDNIGVNWKSVNIVCNGTIRSFTKDANGLLTFTLSDDEYDKELFVNVTVTDLSKNTNQIQKSFNVLSGIENVINANYFILYPNPAKSTITIELPQAVMFDKIEILDITGKVMLKLNVINKQVIDIDVFPRGVYFVRSGNHSQKFIKQ